MHNFRLERTDPRSLVVNQRIVNDHMDAEHYVRWIFPQDMYLEKDTTRGHRSLRDNYIIMADAAAPTIHWDLGVPGQWRDGQIETVVWYSGSAGSTANFSLTLRAYRQKVGTNVDTMTPAVNAAQSMPGPATFGNLLTVTRAQYLAITQEHPMVSWVMGRNVADANTGELWIFAVRHRYIPAQHVA